MKRFTAFTIALLLMLVFVGSLLAYTGWSWDTPPDWDGNSYTYQVSVNENVEAPAKMCVNVKRETDSGGCTQDGTWYWCKYECTGSGTTWDCTVPDNHPAGFDYQFYVANDGNCDNLDGGNVPWPDNWSGETVYQETGPNAVTLTKLTGRTSILTLAAGLMLALGAIVAWRRK